MYIFTYSYILFTHKYVYHITAQRMRKYCNARASRMLLQYSKVACMPSITVEPDQPVHTIDLYRLSGVHTTVPSGGQSVGPYGGASGIVSGVRRCVRRLSVVCPSMSDVCPPDSESRTQRLTVRRTVRRTRRVHRTGGVVVIAREYA